MSKIIVIADDFSGAAEIASVAVRHGLATEVQTAFAPDTDAQVICVDSDTRSLQSGRAADIVVGFATRIAAAKPAWIFKKCDSILRGSVLAEARAVAGAVGRRRLMILPANPSRGRVIRGGTYFVQRTPLHETEFAFDPEHPRTTSNVEELLGADQSGLITPDVETAADVIRHAATVDEDMLPVGGADFFQALLEMRVPSKAAPTQAEPAAVSTGRTLLVCGSVAAWEKRFVEASSLGIPVFTLPHGSAKMAEGFRTSRRVLVGIGATRETHGHSAPVLVTRLAQVVTEMLKQTAIDQLLLEGGATAAAVVRRMGWRRLAVRADSGNGVGVLRPIDENADVPTLYVKPGSYPWPQEIWPGQSSLGT